MGFKFPWFDNPLANSVRKVRVSWADQGAPGDVRLLGRLQSLAFLLSELAWCRIEITICSRRRFGYRPSATKQVTVRP